MPRNDPAHLRRATEQALKDYIDRHLIVPPLPGVKSPPDTRRGLTARMDALERSHGGVKAAAAAAGVTPRTWGGWRKGGRPSRKSLGGLQSAYEADLSAKAQTPARKRRHARSLASGSRPYHVYVRARAEIQWHGYYNGQVGNVGAKYRHPPLPDNRAAFRPVDFHDNGPIDLRPVLHAWDNGQDAGEALEQALDAITGGDEDAHLFLNTYYRTAIEVRFTPHE